MEQTLNYFEQKAVMAKEFSEIYDYLQTRLDNLNSKWAVIGKEDEQATSWSTGELLWEDEEKTIPKYRNKYGDVPKTAEDYTEEDKIKITAVKKVMVMLEKAL